MAYRVRTITSEDRIVEGDIFVSINGVSGYSAKSVTKILPGKEPKFEYGTGRQGITINTWPGFIVRKAGDDLELLCGNNLTSLLEEIKTQLT